MMCLLNLSHMLIQLEIIIFAPYLKKAVELVTHTVLLTYMFKTYIFDMHWHTYMITLCMFLYTVTSIQHLFTWDLNSHSKNEYSQICTYVHSCIMSSHVFSGPIQCTSRYTFPTKHLYKLQIDSGVALNWYHFFLIVHFHLIQLDALVVSFCSCTLSSPG
jgi:hypothetical protein